MSFSPVFQTHTGKDKPTFNNELCIFCQSRSNETLVHLNEETLTKILITCQMHASVNTGKYCMLNEVLKNETNNAERFLYHYKCNRVFNRDKSNLERSLKRLADNRKTLEDTPVTKQRRLSRSQLTSFDSLLCLFCQAETNDKLHNITQDSKDIELKVAFEECPSSLDIYKIRSLRAYDAMAGDLKYHQICWNKIIIQRVVEVPVILSPNTETPLLLSPIHPSSTIPCLSPKSHLSSLVLPSRTLNLEGEQHVQNTLITNKNETVAEANEEFSVVQELVIAEIISGVEEALANKQVLNIGDVANVYKKRMQNFEITDSRSDKTIRKFLKRRLQKNIPEIDFVTSVEKVPQRIIIKEFSKHIIHLAEKKATEDDTTEIGILKKAATILRRKALQHIQKDASTFQGSIEASKTNCNELNTFLKWVVTGDQLLNDNLDLHSKIQSQTIASNILYSTKSERQVKYFANESEAHQPRHTYFPAHHIGIGLTLRHYDRNNTVLNLLSAPHYGLSISPRQCAIWETSIANKIIDNMEEHGNCFIPPNLVKYVLVFHHIDNIDWLEDRANCKNTSHFLQHTVFQRKTGPDNQFILNLEKPTSLKLKENTFNELLYHSKPSKANFQRSIGCVNFQKVEITSAEIRSNCIAWMYLRAFEQLFHEDSKHAWVDAIALIESSESRKNSNINADHSENLHITTGEDIHDTYFDNLGYDLEMLKRRLEKPIENLCIPSFSATNSVLSDVDTSLTNIFNTPLVPGPASSYSAIYTALMRSQNISTWVCGVTSKVVVSLDLDLFEKIYPMVHSNVEMRKRYILCLGELHAVFAHIRAIGTYITSSGLDSAWISANWFDSECLVRQVTECKNMKRAIATLEATFITIGTLFLKEVIKEFSKELCEKGNDILNLINMSHVSIESGDREKFRMAWNNFLSEMESLEIDAKLNFILEKKKSNKLLQFLMGFVRMVDRLFSFIEASRTRDWLKHLSAAESLMRDFCSMNRIKYRRMWAVYIADMRSLETTSPEVWQAFMDGDFNVQKSEIPATAIGRDHAGEQQNKVIKNRGGITGITCNENSRTRHFLIAPVLSAIAEEMQQLGGVVQPSSKKHHQLNNKYTSFQNDRVLSLLSILENNSQMKDDEVPFMNIITGQVFSDEIFTSLMECENVGQKLYEDFIVDRLRPDSQVSIFAPLKKSQVKTCKFANKKQHIKIHNKVVELKENCNLFARCALMQGKREVDMEDVIGSHELNTVPLSLFNDDGSMILGGVGKADAVTEVLAGCGVQKNSTLPVEVDSVIIDAMRIVNEINPKPLWIKNGLDFAKEFNKRVDNISKNCSLVMVVFDSYPSPSIKDVTSETRRANNKPRIFSISNETNIERVTMGELLASKDTKKSITTYFMKTLEEHLKSRHVDFVIAGNSITRISIGLICIEKENNHVEGDTLVIAAMEEASESLIGSNLLVYSSDTDVCFLLINHCNRFQCNHIYQQVVSGFVNINEIVHILGDLCSTAILVLHGITGCDTVGRFSGKTKEFWFRRFMSFERQNQDLVQALVDFSNSTSENSFIEIEGFICRGYLFPRSKTGIKQNEVYDIKTTRYKLFTQKKFEGSKLPPTKGALQKHLDRAHYQILQWNFSYLAVMPDEDPLNHGWVLENNKYQPEMTDGLIAPTNVLELVSCNCDGKCSSRKCSCVKNNVVCTDYCGCCDYCENTDVEPNINDDDDIIEDEHCQERMAEG